MTLSRERIADIAAGLNRVAWHGHAKATMPTKDAVELCRLALIGMDAEDTAFKLARHVINGHRAVTSSPDTGAGS